MNMKKIKKNLLLGGAALLSLTTPAYALSGNADSNAGNPLAFSPVSVQQGTVVKKAPTQKKTLERSLCQQSPIDTFQIYEVKADGSGEGEQIGVYSFKECNERESGSELSRVQTALSTRIPSESVWAVNKKTSSTFGSQENPLPLYVGGVLNPEFAKFAGLVDTKKGDGKVDGIPSEINIMYSLGGPSYVNNTDGYLFADDANNIFDIVSLEKDSAGNYTGFTNIVYDGDINKQKRVKTEDHLKRIREGFDNPGFVNDRKERYMGLVHVMDGILEEQGTESRINGAENLLRYMVEAQNVAPMGTSDWATFVDVVAFNDYMDDLMSTHMNADGVLEFTENNKTQLIEKYRLLGVSADKLDVIAKFTSPVGILFYVANGFSFDRNNNLTNHGSLNYIPNVAKFAKSLDEEVVMNRFAENKFVYGAHLGGVDRK